MASAKDKEYEVGFGKPPRNMQFQKGKSGNPKGRPRGSKNTTTLLNKALDEKVTINENGQRKAISKREALFKQLANKGAGGDPKAIQILLGEFRAIDAREAPQTGAEVLGEDDLKVIEELRRQFGNRVEDEDDDGSGTV